MRLYVPATLSELDEVKGNKINLTPRRAHTATEALIRQYAVEDITDIEEVEYGAFMAAADDSLMLIAAAPNEQWTRVIISVDVPDAAVAPVEAAPDEALSAVDITQDLGPTKIVCVHVDEPEAAGDIQGVLEGKETAIIALGERDLLWYDVSELGMIPR